MAEVFKYEFCTKVQAQSLPPCLSGQDVLAKAKTGTGKTLVRSSGGVMVPHCIGVLWLSGSIIFIVCCLN